MLLYILVAIAIVCLVLFFTVSSKHKYFSVRGVPQTKPLFFYGDYKAVVTGEKHNGIVTKEIYDANKHLAYVGFYMLNTPALLINDPELVKDVLIKDFASFSNNNLDVSPNEKYLYNNPFAAKGDFWKQIRGFLTPTLTASRMKTVFAPNMESKANNLVTHLKETCEKSVNPEVDAKEIASVFATDVITASTMGIDINSFQEPNSLFRRFTKSIFFPTLLNDFKMLLPLIYPVLGSFLSISVHKDHQNKIIDTITKDALEQRRNPGQRGNDLISHLLGLREKQSADVITDEFIASQVWGFFMDGFDTSSTVITYTLFELGLNLDVQEALRKEINSSCEANDGKLVYDELMSLKYLDMVVLESLRLHSPALSMERVCTNFYTFPPATPGAKPLQVEPGMPVIIPVQGLHMDEKYYPEPQKFNPENFTSEAIASRPKCTFLAFGEGPRICLGSRLGLAQVKTAVATLVRNFEIRTPSSSVELGNSLNVHCLIKRSVKPIMIKFTSVK